MEVDGVKYEKEFIVARPFDEIAADLSTDRTLEALFPNTEFTRRDDGTIETRTPFEALGSSRDIRFIVSEERAGLLHFSKICDGNVWRSLEGDLCVEEVDARASRVVLELEGRTRAFVPELTIRVPMREQIEQMAKNLRSQLESAA